MYVFFLNRQKYRSKKCAYCRKVGRWSGCGIVEDCGQQQVNPHFGENQAKSKSITGCSERRHHHRLEHKLDQIERTVNQLVGFSLKIWIWKYESADFYRYSKENYEPYKLLLGKTRMHCESVLTIVKWGCTRKLCSTNGINIHYKV